MQPTSNAGSRDRRRYPTGKKVTAKELRELKIERDAFHGEWNYVIRPRNEMQ
jgi:Rhodopirellula transposase DDE domain